MIRRRIRQLCLELRCSRVGLTLRGHKTVTAARIGLLQYVDLERTTCTGWLRGAAEIAPHEWESQTVVAFAPPGEYGEETLKDALRPWATVGARMVLVPIRAAAIAGYQRAHDQGE